MANPTIAKDIATYFFKVKEWKIVSSQFAIPIKQAKYLLDSGFTYEEIISGIDYLVANPPKNGFKSIGYLNYVLNEILDKIKQEEEMKKIKQMQTQGVIRGEAIGQTNREKLQGHSIESRVGAKYSFDMFKESDKDS